MARVVRLNAADDTFFGTNVDEDAFALRGNDRIFGNDGNEVIRLDEGDDRGEGGVAFLFEGESGRGVIRDFENSDGEIGVNSAGGDDLDDLIIRSDANGVAVVYLDGNTGPGAGFVTLLDVSRGRLSSEDSFFVVAGAAVATIGWRRRGG